MVTEHAHTTTVNFSPSPVAPTATRVSLTPSQTPSDICASQNPCEDRGSCQADVIEGYKCVCLEYFIGQDCSIDISMLFSLVVIVFVFLCNCHKRGKWSRWSTGSHIKYIGLLDTKLCPQSVKTTTTSKITLLHVLLHCLFIPVNIFLPILTTADEGIQSTWCD